MFRPEDEQFIGETTFEKLSLVNMELNSAINHFERIPLVNNNLSSEIGDSRKQGIRSWLRREIDYAEERLTETERKKIHVASRIWAVNSAISIFLGVPLGGFSLYRSLFKGDYKSVLINLIPGAMRLGTIIGVEQLSGVKFQRLPKVLAFIPTFPSGFSMPLAIAQILDRNEAFKEYLLERFSFNR